MTVTMPEIPNDAFSGGSGITEGTGKDGVGDLAQVLQTVKTDLDSHDGDLGTQGSAITALQGQTTAIGLENTDGEAGIDILSGIAGSGTWTKSMQATGPRVRRTASNGNEDFWIHCPLPTRRTASKGRKVTGVVANYEVDTADLDDVRFELYKVSLGADDAARTRTLLGGDQDAEYDAAHDTSVKRGDDTNGPELHRAQVTLPAPAYVAADEQIWLRIFCDGDAGGAGVLDVTAAKLLFSETLVDLA